MKYLDYVTVPNALFLLLSLIGCLAVMYCMKLAMVKGRPSKTAIFLIAFPGIIALAVIIANLLSVEQYPAGVMLLVAFQMAIFLANRLKFFPKFSHSPRAISSQNNDSPDDDPLIRTISEP